MAQASKEVHIHAFEPSLATRSMLAARFAENVAVTVQPYALSERVGEATFYSNEDGAGTNSLSPSSGSNVEVVKLITIDQFLQQSGNEIALMVKIDTEGFDLIADKPYRLGKLSGDSIEFYDQGHFELDRFFENNYVLVRNDSNLRLLGSMVQFDESNVGVLS